MSDHHDPEHFNDLLLYLGDSLRGTARPDLLVNILDDVAAERKRQNEKFGDQSHRSLGLWNVILGEEYGEAQREMCDLSFEDEPRQRLLLGQRLREELIQTMAVCAAIIEAGDEHGWGSWPDERRLRHGR